MQKNESPFTDQELTHLRGSFSSIGRKYKITGEYVGQIAAGKRLAKTDMAKAVMQDLKKLLTLLKPKS
jgi:hypothetical protein